MIQEAHKAFPADVEFVIPFQNERILTRNSLATHVNAGPSFLRGELGEGIILQLIQRLTLTSKKLAHEIPLEQLLLQSRMAGASWQL